MFTGDWTGLGGSCGEMGVFMGMGEAGHLHGAMRGGGGVSRGPREVDGSMGLEGLQGSPRGW